MILPQPLPDTADLDAWLRDLAPLMEAAADRAAEHRDADPLLDVDHDDAPALPWERARTEGDVILPQPIPAPALCEEPPPAWMDRCARGEYAHGRGEQGPATIRWRGVA